MAIFTKEYKYSAWYFISKLTVNSSITTLIDLASCSTIHYAQSESSPDYTIVFGFAYLRERKTLAQLESLFTSFQWIPTIIGDSFSGQLGVKFKEWQLEDFDTSSFLESLYPWDHVKNFLDEYHDRVLPSAYELFNPSSSQEEDEEDLFSDVDV